MVPSGREQLKLDISTSLGGGDIFADIFANLICRAAELARRPAQSPTGRGFDRPILGINLTAAQRTCASIFGVFFIDLFL